MSIILWIALGIIVLVLACGIRIVRPTKRMLVETLGKYRRISKPGFNWIIPIIQRGIYVNITEQMTDAAKQDVITKDRLNTTVDAVVFYKVKSEENDVKASQYNVQDYKQQIVTIAKTTLRNIIGDMKYEEANSKRDRINDALLKTLKKEVTAWGIEIVRTEMKEIDPPRDVQDSMNEVIKAENAKNAAVDFATATETEADGKKRAAIKEAEGIAAGRKKVAEANAYKIQKENEAAQKYFKANAIKLKQLEVALGAMEKNAKVIIGKDTKDILKLFNIDK